MDPHVDNQKDGGIKKVVRKRVSRPGQKALKEIKYYQVSDKTFIPVAAMQRAVRHILGKLQAGGARIKPEAFKMLHAGAEEHLTTLFKGTQLMALHAKRKTIQAEDLHNLQRVCTVMSGANDLDTDPVNARMSEAHKKTKTKRRKRSATVAAVATIATPRPKKMAPIKKQVVVVEQADDEVVEQIIVEHSPEFLHQEKEQEEYDDEWLLEED